MGPPPLPGLLLGLGSFAAGPGLLSGVWGFLPFPLRAWGGHTNKRCTALSIRSTLTEGRGAWFFWMNEYVYVVFFFLHMLERRAFLRKIAALARSDREMSRKQTGGRATTNVSVCFDHGACMNAPPNHLSCTDALRVQKHRIVTPSRREHRVDIGGKKYTYVYVYVYIYMYVCIHIYIHIYMYI